MLYSEKIIVNLEIFKIIVLNSILKPNKNCKRISGRHITLLYLPACAPSNYLYFSESTPERKTRVPPTPIEEDTSIRTATPDTSGQELLFEVTDTMAVDNGVTADAVYKINKSWLITQIITYHWNGATGAEPGTIALRAQDGTLYGPWQASGLPGQNNVLNAHWIVYPMEVIPKGTYTIVDSDPSTWSSNFNTDGVGMVCVRSKTVRCSG